MKRIRMNKVIGIALLGTLFLYSSNPIEAAEYANETVEEALESYTPLTYFSNGAAWVSYEDSYGNKMTGIMNENGQVVFSEDSSVEWNDFAGDEYTYVYTNGSWEIIDTQGNIHAVIENTEDSRYEIFAHGDGAFLVREDYSDFAGTATNIYAINPEGEILGEKHSYLGENDATIKDVFYCGDGLFIFNNQPYGSASDSKYDAFNVSEDTYFNLHVFYYFPFFNGNTYMHGEVFLDPGYIFFSGEATKADLMNEESWKAWIENNGSDMPLHEHMNMADYCGEDIIASYRYTSSFSNYESFNYEEEKWSIPPYPEGVKVGSFGYYSNGLMPVELTGNDGKTYITMLDKEGNEVLPPFKMPDDYQASKYSDTSHERIQTYPYEELKSYTPSSYAAGELVYKNSAGEYVIINSAGETRTLPSYDDESFMGYDGNYIYTKTGIYSISDGEMIFGYVG